MKPDPYTHKKLIEYVMSMFAQGWDTEVVKRELRWAGHSQKVIDAVLHEVLSNYGRDVHAPAEAIAESEPEEHQDHHHQQKHPPRAVEELDKEQPDLSTFASFFLMKSTSVEKTFSAIFFVLIFILIIWTGLSSESPVANVFIGFLPIILTIFTVFAFYDYFEGEKQLGVLLAPLVWCGLFIVAAAYSALPLFASLDVQNIAMLNFVLGLVYVGLVYFLSNIERSLVDKERMKTKHRKVIAEITGEEKRDRHGAALAELDTLFRELEESVKHLNASVNKVYAQAHGGSPAVREAVLIPFEWFQEYKHTSLDHGESKLKAAKKAVTQTYERLMTMKKHEKDVFGVAASEFHLVHDKQGKSAVIDVLVANDQAVHPFYDRAMNSCSKAIEVLQHAGVLPKR